MDISITRFGFAPPATILTGPNGSGKTHLLRIVRALVALDFRDLVAYPFISVELEYSDKTRLTALRNDNLAPELVVSGHRGDTFLGSIEVGPVSEEEALGDIPPWIERAASDMWWDQEMQEIASTAELRRRYPGGVHEDETWLVDSQPWLRAFSTPTSPVFIETGRLDLALRPVPYRPDRQTARRRRLHRAPIERYVAKSPTKSRKHGERPFLFRSAPTGDSPPREARCDPPNLRRASCLAPNKPGVRVRWPASRPKRRRPDRRRLSAFARIGPDSRCPPRGR